MFSTGTRLSAATLRMKALPLPQSQLRMAMPWPIRLSTRAVSSAVSPWLTCSFSGLRSWAWPPSWVMPGLERIAGARALFPEQHEQRAVAQQRVRLVAVELALEVSARLEHEFEFVAGPFLGVDEVASLQRLAHVVSPWILPAGADRAGTS